MTDDRWEKLVEMVTNSFTVLEHERGSWNEDKTEKIEFLIFQGPLGKMKLERVWQPLVIERKTIGSHRAGALVHEEFVYSDSETTAKTFFYRFVAETQQWQPLSLADFSLEN